MLLSRAPLKLVLPTRTNLHGTWSVLNNCTGLQSSGRSLRTWTREKDSTSNVSPFLGSKPLSTDSASTHLIEFSSSAADDICHFKVVPGFVTSSEEQCVLKEVTRALRRRKYQYDHWDGVS